MLKAIANNNFHCKNGIPKLAYRMC